MSNLSLPPTNVSGWSSENSIDRIPYKQLGQTDMYVSLLSYGAAHVSYGVTIDQNGQLCNVENAIEAIREAIRLGINLIDTSPFYGMGLSEIIVGQALKVVPRQAYYLATKVGRHPDCSFNYQAVAVKQSVEESLKKLGVDYIDLIHVHDVEFCPSIDMLLNETLPILEELRKQGKIRYIGISGYPLSTIKTIVEKSRIRIDVILSYCRHTLWDNELVNYLEFFKSKKIGVINAAIFGMGLLSESIPTWHPASETIRQACQKARAICQSHVDIPITRLALRHSLREKRIHTHLIGMESVAIVKENLSMITKINERSYDQDTDDDEEKLLDLILTQVFSQGSNVKQTMSNHWEQVELDRYHRDPEEFVRFLRKCFSGE